MGHSSFECVGLRPWGYANTSSWLCSGRERHWEGRKRAVKMEGGDGQGQPGSKGGDSVLGPGHPVADTRLRKHESWVPGIVAKLSAEKADERTEQPGLS